MADVVKTNLEIVERMTTYPKIAQCHSREGGKTLTETFTDEAMGFVEGENVTVYRKLDGENYRVIMTQCGTRIIASRNVVLSVENAHTGSKFCFSNPKNSVFALAEMLYYFPPVAKKDTALLEGGLFSFSKNDQLAKEFLEGAHVLFGEMMMEKGNNIYVPGPATFHVFDVATVWDGKLEFYQPVDCNKNTPAGRILASYFPSEDEMGYRVCEAIRYTPWKRRSLKDTLEYYEAMTTPDAEGVILRSDDRKILKIRYDDLREALKKNKK